MKPAVMLAHLRRQQSLVGVSGAGRGNRAGSVMGGRRQPAAVWETFISRARGWKGAYCWGIYHWGFLFLLSVKLTFMVFPKFIIFFLAAFLMCPLYWNSSCFLRSYVSCSFLKGYRGSVWFLKIIQNFGVRFFFYRSWNGNVDSESSQLRCVFEMREIRNVSAKIDFHQILNIFAKVRCERHFWQ